MGVGGGDMQGVHDGGTCRWRGSTWGRGDRHAGGTCRWRSGAWGRGDRYAGGTCRGYMEVVEWYLGLG